MNRFKTVWFWDSGIEATDSYKYVMSFFDDSHPKPSVVSGIACPSHVTCHSFNHVDENGRIVVNMVSEDFADICNLWYVQAPDIDPQLSSFVAYADDRFPNGTVLSPMDVAEYQIAYKDSVGFIRWFKGDSRIQQIFVKEEFRRQKISIKLIGVADLLIVANKDWNGKFLNGGDITTADGEALRSAWKGSTRVIDRIGTAEL